MSVRLIILLLLLVPSISFGQEVLKDKTPLAEGACVFSRDGTFQAFAQKFIAPRGLFVIKRCVLLAKNETLNPSWLAIVDNDGVREVIEWRDPAIFTIVYERFKHSIRP